MQDILLNITSMLERFGRMETLSEIALGAYAVLLFFGVLNCILGYRLLRFWMMLGGFFVGAGLAFSIANGFGYSDRTTLLTAMGIAGVVLAVIAFMIYRAGIFLLGAGIGWALSIYILHPTSSASFFLCVLVGVGLGSLGVRYSKEVIIVSTSLIGGVLAGISLAKIGSLPQLPYGAGMSLGIALLGMVIQFAINKTRYEEEEEPETPESNRPRKHSSDDFYNPAEDTGYDPYSDDEEELLYEEEEAYFGYEQDEKEEARRRAASVKQIRQKQAEETVRQQGHKSSGSRKKS